jgi:hypothetical protein
MSIVRDAGSFRDPAGYVAHYDHRIFRILREDAFNSFEWLRASGLLADLVANKWLVPTDISTELAIQGVAPRVLERGFRPRSWRGRFVRSTSCRGGYGPRC